MMEMNSWLRFVVGILATWRITHLLAAEDGPADIIVRLRRQLGNSFAGGLMDCFHCLSLWVGALAALAVTRHFVEWLCYSMAFSGAACLLERLGQPIASVFPASGQEGDEEKDYVLWKQENRTGT